MSETHTHIRMHGLCKQQQQLEAATTAMAPCQVREGAAKNARKTRRLVSMQMKLSQQQR